MDAGSPSAQPLSLALTADLAEQALSLLIARGRADGVPGYESLYVPERFAPSVEKLSASQLSSTLRVLAANIQMLAGEELTAVVNALVSLLQTLPVAALSAKILPGQQDTEATIDDFTEDTADFWLVQTLRRAIDNATVSPSALARIDPAIVSLLLDRLGHTHTPAVRHEAAQCLGLLSADGEKLSVIVENYRVRMDEIRKADDCRRFVTRQRAVGALHFSFGTAAAASATIAYLTALLEALPRIDRGVLRQAVASSLSEVFERLLDSASQSTTDRCAATALQQDPALAEKFWSLYNQLFALVNKWAKKPKHALFSWTLLGSMARLGNREFQSSPAPLTLLRALVTSVGKETDLEHREKVFGIIYSYFALLPSDTVETCPEAFLEQLEFVVDGLIARRAPYAVALTDADLTHIEKLLAHAAGKQLQSALRIFEKLIALPERDLRPDLRVAVVRALATTVSAGQQPVQRDIGASASLVNAPAVTPGPGFHAIVRSATPVLYKLVTPLLSVYAQPNLIAAALGCFPALQATSAERRKELLLTIGELSLLQDRKIANAAARCLVELLASHPSLNLVPVVYLFATLIGKTLTAGSYQEVLIRVFNNVGVVLSSYAAAVRAAESSIADEAGPTPTLLEAPLSVAVNPVEYRAARQRLEGCCLAWMVHSESWIRLEAAKVLVALGKPELRAIEGLPDDSGLLVDVLLPGSAGSVPSASEELFTLPQSLPLPLLDLLAAAGKPESALRTQHGAAIVCAWNLIRDAFLNFSRLGLPYPDSDVAFRMPGKDVDPLIFALRIDSAEFELTLPRLAGVEGPSAVLPPALADEMGRVRVNQLAFLTRALLVGDLTGLARGQAAKEDAAAKMTAGGGQVSLPGGQAPFRRRAVQAAARRRRRR
jgi:hypothetical protein